VARRCKDGSLGASLVLAVESDALCVLGAWGPVRTFISPSRFMAATMSRAGVFPDRLELLDHFVDPRPLSPKSLPGGPVVFAGRLAPEKGVAADRGHRPAGAGRAPGGRR
jgi:hypothetical protein